MIKLISRQVNVFVTPEVVYYAPNFKEVEGAYRIGLVRLSVMLLGACETRECLMLET